MNRIQGSQYQIVVGSCANPIILANLSRHVDILSVLEYFHQHYNDKYTPALQLRWWGSHTDPIPNRSWLLEDAIEHYRGIYEKQNK